MFGYTHELSHEWERRTTLRDFQAGLVLIDAICDADFLLKAAAEHHGADSDRPCPICESTMQVVTWVHGERLGRRSNTARSEEEIDRLVAEAKIALNDVESVRVGQAARLKLSAFRSQELPLLDGKVIYISADRQTDPQSGAYFLARVEFDRAALERHAGGAVLNAGMPVEAYLIGERRTALDYVARPLRDSLRRSLRD